MSADDLIASLGAQGTLERHGAFALDVQKAREKMAQFQLVSPHHYVLELVQAAHLLGSRAIYFRIDIDEVELWFEGESLNEDELSQLYVAAFERSDEPKRQAMRHLAIALNATRALNMREVVLESRGQGYDAKLVVRAGQEVIAQGSSLEAPGLRFYARQRVRLSHVWELITPRHDPAEKYLLRERCRFANRPIVLNGEDIAVGMRLPKEVEGIVGFSTEHEHGLLGCLDPTHSSSEIRLMQHGVLLETYRQPADRVPVSAIVDSARLRKDLSQSAFVQDEVWHHLLNVVMRKAMYESLCTILSEELEDGDERSLDKQARHEVLLESMLLELTTLEGHLELEAALRAVIALFEDQALLRRADAAGVVSLCELAHGDVLRYSHELQRNLTLDDEGPVLFASRPEHVEGVAKYLGLKAKDYTEQLRAKELYRFNRSIWALRKFEGLKDELVALTCQEGELSVTWSWSSSPKARVVWVKDGCVLRQERLEDGLLPGVTLLISGPLQENERFDDVIYDEQLAILVDRGVGCFPAFISAVAELDAPDKVLRRDLFLRYMQELLDGTLRDRLLDALGCDELCELIERSERRKHNTQRSLRTLVLKILDKIIPSAPKTLSPWSLSTQRPQEWHLARLRRLGENIGHVAHAPLLEELRGRWFSLMDVLDLLEGNKPLRCLFASTQASMYLTVLSDDEPVFWLDTQDIERLGQLLGSSRLLNAEEDLKWRLTRQRFMEQPTREPTLKELGVFKSTFSYAKLRGELVWRFESFMLDAGESLKVSDKRVMRVGASKQIDVVLDYEDRPLDELSWSWPLGSVAFHVSTTRVTPEIQLKAVYEDAKTDKLRERLEREAQEALLVWMTSHREDAYRLKTRELIFVWARLGLILHDVQLLDREVGPQLYDVCRQLKCFEDSEGRALSLDDVEGLLRGESFLHYVVGQAQVMSSLLKSSSPPVILRAPELKEVEDALNLIFLNYRLIDCSSTEENERAYKQALDTFMARPECDVWSESFKHLGWGERFFFEEDGFECVVVMNGSVRQWVAQPSSQVSILYKGRLLEVIEQPVPLGCFEIFIRYETLSVSPDIRRADDTQQRQELLQRGLEWSLKALILWFDRLTSDAWIKPDWDEQVLWLWGLLGRGSWSGRSSALNKVRDQLSRYPKHLEALRRAKLFKVWSAAEAWSWDALVRTSAPIWVVIGDQERPQDLPKDAIFLEVPDRESFRALSAALEPRVCSEYGVRSEAADELSQEPNSDEERSQVIAQNVPEVRFASEASSPAKLEDDSALLTLEVACELLLEAVNADQRLLVGGRLDPLVLVEGGVDDDTFALADGQKTRINRAHKLCSYALDDVDAEDVFVQAFVSSSVYSAMNVFYEQVKPSHELEFHERMMDVLLARWGD